MSPCPALQKFREKTGKHFNVFSNSFRFRWDRNLRWYLVAFKGTTRRNPFRGEHIYCTVAWNKIFEVLKVALLNLKFWLHGVMHTAESKCLNFVIEYLGEIKTEFENTLPCLSGAQMGSNHEQNRGRKSRDTLPLIYGAL